MNCMQCGESWYDCTCIGWCYEHGCPDQSPYKCQACSIAFEEKQDERRQTVNTKPWYVRLWWKIRWGI